MWMDDYGVNVEDNPEIIPVLSEKSNDANTSKNNMLWGLSHFSKNIFFFSFYAQTKFKSVLMKRPADTLVIKAWFKFSIFPLGLEIIYIYAFFIQRIKSNFSQLFCSYNSHPIWLHRITSHMQKKTLNLSRSATSSPEPENNNSDVIKGTWWGSNYDVIWEQPTWHPFYSVSWVMTKKMKI